MIGASLKKLFGIGSPAEDPSPVGGLTAADEKAIAADLSVLNRIEPDLGEAAARYVLTGEDATFLLRLGNLLQSGHPRYWETYQVLEPHGAHTDNPKDYERHAKARERVVLDLEGFDPGVLRRYGELFALQAMSSSYRWNYPGTDASPTWARSLVHIVAGKLQNHQNRDRKGFGFLTAPRILAMLEDGEASAFPALIDCGFSGGETSSYDRHTPSYLAMPGFTEALAAAPSEAVAAIAALGSTGRQVMIQFLAREGLIDAEPRFFDFVFASAGNSARTAREAAIAALATSDETRIRDKAAEALGSKQSADRLAAVNVLLARLGSDALPLLEAHEAGGEKAKAVLQAIATARASAAVGGEGPEGQADGPDGYVAFDGSFVSAPTTASEAEPPLPADLEGALRAVLEATNAAAQDDYARTPVGKEWNQRKAKPFRPPVDPAAARHVVAAMKGAPLSDDEAGAARIVIDPRLEYWSSKARDTHSKQLAALLSRSDVSIEALANLVFAIRQERAAADVLRTALGSEGHAYSPAGFELQKRYGAGADLRIFEAAAQRSGYAMSALFRETKGRWFNLPERPRVPTNETVWPVLMAEPAMLDEAFGGPTGRLRDQGADFGLLALSFFPKLPRRYFPVVVDRAAQGQKRGRDYARWLLRDVAELTPVITPMLEAGAEATRIAGARWLAERRDDAAVPALRKALEKEKGVGATAAIISALALCGDDVSDQFSEDKLLADARKGLAKTKADFSALFDAEALPALHWADGREVPAEVVRWWFVRAHKLKNAGGDPLLHMALERLDRGDAERLGLQILNAFVAFDTARPSSEEANAYAAENAKRTAEYRQRWQKDFTEDLAFAELRREKLAVYLNSALDHRGLLALAAYAPAADAAAIVKRYLRDHGKRANQCRALVDMLMAKPEPASLQLVLAASQRHKQPGLRKYAGEVTARFAEERGWSPAELADRTIPAVGLDETGTLELPVGERTFRARLETVKAKKTGAPELRLALQNPDGKPVASLPSPSDPDEAAEAKEAKGALSAAKKELKQTVELQTGRLYEAMCAGRIWPVADFQSFLLAHPVMNHLLRRLVLTGHDAQGNVVQSLRALDDGTFTDAEDERVEIDGFAGIGIAHRASLGDEASAAWTQHLEDYEVSPLFEQFQRPAPGETKAEARVIDDRRGHMIDNLTLRSAAENLGYIRGSVEDGAGFYAYEKSFPDSGLVAVIEFSGSYVGENDRVPKYLTTLAFEPSGPERVSRWGGGSGVALSDVPPVLVSEAWNDYREIAAKGTGFDPEHEKKGGW
ncbi:DUF4132 domain-containing protein [Aureimonas sp. ME7]|uniref:DUF4132 domain-containing protein n=1 Tax=Aureimonas sp. ME7 TaxID=2744252 RepID=UPI0015F49416|nr:DUF4132 domain-containing protein [Aureimonas sp. ME7]